MLTTKISDKVQEELKAILQEHQWETVIDLYQMDWDHLCIEHTLSEDFIEYFQDKLNWDLISKYQILSEQFIEKFQDKVFWDYISEYQILSKPFIVKHQDKLDMNYLIRENKFRFKI